MEDKLEAELAPTTNEDQPAEAAERATEPAAAAAAEHQAAPQSQSDGEREKVDSKPPSARGKPSPAKAKASEAVQPEKAVSGRRERKQTAFFKPAKITETEKLEIKEVGQLLPTNNVNLLGTCEHLPGGEQCNAAVSCRAKAPSLVTSQMVSLIFECLILPVPVSSVRPLFIGAVAFHLGKVTGRDELLEDLHQILYSRKGKVQ